MFPFPGLATMPAEEAMDEELSIQSLRQSILQKDRQAPSSEEQLFEQAGRRYERAVQRLIQDIRAVVDQIPELKVTLEDEAEVFSSPAFPGRTMTITDQRLRISRGDAVLLFDPTAHALLSALGQIEIAATQPIPFMIERVLYLIPGPEGSTARWGYRAADDATGPLSPFNQTALLRTLHAVFAAG
jgi:hypothetical protein